MATLHKILLVEDNSQLREIYSITLQASGFDVRTAHDGQSALQEATTFGPDLVFLDVMMPGMSGLEVLDAMRASPEYKCQTAKIVLLTNLGHEDRVSEAWKKKADGYAVKSDISSNDLVDIIHSFDTQPATDPQHPVLPT